MSDAHPSDDLEPIEDDPDVPVWDDEYLDRVSDRLMFNFDLERDVVHQGEPFAMYGEMHVHHQKHFFHPLLSFAHHDDWEYLFARRTGVARREELERLVGLGHDLADEWVDADEEHYSTEFTFVLIADELPADVKSFVSDFRERTLIKKGYYGHYEIHLLVVVPETEELVASREAQLEEAFRLWERIENPDPTWWDLFKRRLQL